MNLDLLKKLTRLANNNPNDNEANLAARKVAKMLQDSNWALPAGPSIQQPKPEPSIKDWVDPRTGNLHIEITQIHLEGRPKLRDILKALKDELLRPSTWNDVKRSAEPGFRSKPPTEAEQARYNDEHRKRWRDIYEQYERDKARYAEEYAKQTKGSWEHEPTDRERKAATDFFNEFFRNITDEQRRRWQGFREGTWETKRSPFDREYYPFAGEARKRAGFGVGVDWSGGGAKSNAHSTKEKRKLKCTRCGVERDTAYVGNLYVCIDCYWKEYNDKRGEATG